jgi:hypothetical protein
MALNSLPYYSGRKLYAGVTFVRKDIFRQDCLLSICFLDKGRENSQLGLYKVGLHDGERCLIKLNAEHTS